jgi:hypothetical protein
MKDETRSLLKAERRRDTFGFISKTLQRGKLRPKKYQHDLTIPAFLYEELRDRNIIDFQTHYLEEVAFFEYDDNAQQVIISFISLWACEDIHVRILRYLVTKFAGQCPITRGGRFNV